MATREHAAILSGMVAIMHPNMYITGREALVRLGTWAASHGRADITDILALWPSVYNVASIMANRATPLHMDQFGRLQWLDLLVTFGNYTDLQFLIPSLHCQFTYEPGTLIALSGQLLLHGVGSTNGDQGIISYYMRDNVHKFVNVPRCNYMEYSKVPTGM